MTSTSCRYLLAELPTLDAPPIPVGITREELLEQLSALPEGEFAILNEVVCSVDEVADRREYIEALLEEAKKINSKVLTTYLRWDVSLRNAFVIERAKRIDETPNMMLDVQEATDTDFRSMIAEYYAFSNMDEAEQFLARERWSVIDAVAPRFTGSLDELIAYVLKWTILSRLPDNASERGAKVLAEVAE